MRRLVGYGRFEGGEAAQTMAWLYAATRLTEAIVQLATRYGRYGYRRIRRLLIDEG